MYKVINKGNGLSFTCTGRKRMLYTVDSNSFILKTLILPPTTTDKCYL